MTIRAIIVDDEELARRGIRTRLLRSGDVDIIAECRNGKEAIEAVRRKAPDLVFLDVQMPGKSGFDVIESIGWNEFPHVIFVTAHDRFAMRAFEVNALDYLLKPIDDERFDIALARARESLLRERDSQIGRQLASVLNQVATGESPRLAVQPERIVVRSGGRVVFVRISEIDWVEAAGDYITIHAGKKSWLLRETITSMETKLAKQGFKRIHRSTVVKLAKISELKPLDNGEYIVILRDGTELRLSRNYRDALRGFV